MLNKKIISIASDTKFSKLKKNYNFKSSFKNKICGDVIHVELDEKDGKLTEMRFETQACIFTQATAAILSNQIKKLVKKDLDTYIKSIEDFFDKKINKFPIKLKNFDILLDVENLSRKECILLPFRAIKKAIDD